MGKPCSSRLHLLSFLFAKTGNRKALDVDPKFFLRWLGLHLVHTQPLGGNGYLQGLKQFMRGLVESRSHKRSCWKCSLWFCFCQKDCAHKGEKMHLVFPGLATGARWTRKISWEEKLHDRFLSLSPKPSWQEMLAGCFRENTNTDLKTSWGVGVENS